MAKAIQRAIICVILIVLISIFCSNGLQSSQVDTLLRIRSLLNFPHALITWNYNTDFCNLNPTQSVTVVCYEDTITQLHITGENGTLRLPQNFSIDSLITTLVRLPSLKVLTLTSLGLWGLLPGKISRLSSLEILNVSSNFFYGTIPLEISRISNLQSFVLDNNMFCGQIPDFFSSFPALNVLSLRNNSLNGSLPLSISKLNNLRVLDLGNNHLYGEVPDLSRLNDLQMLNLEDNFFGAQFPRIGNKLVTIVLRKNKFRSGLPFELGSFYELQKLDISSNKFMGPFPVTVLSLPSISYLNIADNLFTGMLLENVSCNAGLNFVNLSSNLLTGNVPECLKSKSKTRVLLYNGNCLATGDQSQHEYSFCRNEALAAGVVPIEKKRNQGSKIILGVCIVGGILGVIAVVVLVFWLVRRVIAKKVVVNRPPRLIAENAAGAYTSKILSDARYISQTMKLGALGVPAYRTFSLEELEEATNYFDSSTSMGEGSRGQMYRGTLKDGSLVVIRCLKVKQSHSTHYFMPHIELISKLRHRHLVSSIGHCFECYLDDSSVSRLFLVFEYVPSGNLRSWISAGDSKRQLTWAQRIAAAIGIAKGIQFLHTGIVPGIFSNNLKITDILLDQNLAAKISSYNLPLLAADPIKVAHGASTGSKELVPRVPYEDKSDIYDFGVILLEIIVGLQIKTKNELIAFKNQVQAGVVTDEETRRSIVAQEVEPTCSDQSLKTMMEVCSRCVSEDLIKRPSIEDVLWNLQFAAQVQEAWQGGSDSQSSRGSPVSPSPPHRLQYAFH